MTHGPAPATGTRGAEEAPGAGGLVPSGATKGVPGGCRLPSLSGARGGCPNPHSLAPGALSPGSTAPVPPGPAAASLPCLCCLPPGELGVPQPHGAGKCSGVCGRAEGLRAHGAARCRRGRPHRHGDGSPRGCGGSGGEALTILWRRWRRRRRMNSLCCRDTKLTAAYSSRAAKTKSRQTAIQMSMAFT